MLKVFLLLVQWDKQDLVKDNDGKNCEVMGRPFPAKTCHR